MGLLCLYIPVVLISIVILSSQFINFILAMQPIKFLNNFFTKDFEIQMFFSNFKKSVS